MSMLYIHGGRPKIRKRKERMESNKCTSESSEGYLVNNKVQGEHFHTYKYTIVIITWKEAFMVNKYKWSIENIYWVYVAIGQE